MFPQSSLFVIFATIAITMPMKNRAELLRTASSSSARSLSYELIAGYEPSSIVTDHNALDLDQKAMEDQLDTFNAAGFLNAQRIYGSGGHSKSYAVLTLNSPLTEPILIGTILTGTDAEGSVVSGEAYEAAEVGATTLKFRYDVSSSQETYTECHVGGLTETNTVGCLSSNSSVTVASLTGIPYTYDVASDNVNGRTLKGFSTSADTKMRHDEDPTKEFYPDFQKFFDYYGVVDYSDKIVEAAFTGTSVGLNGKTFDFSAYDFEPRGEVVAKTSAYLGVAMYTLRELEDSIDDCLSGDTKRNADSVQALDEAVAFYTGSLEGTDGSGSGVFVHALAEKRCADFKTCGEKGDQIVGNAKVNMNIFSLFSQMQTNIAKRDCAAARLDKEAIAKQLFVPMIQGTIRYAYKQSQKDTNTKAEAEGAAFAAAVLPIVAACNSDAAATIFDEMKPNSGNTANFDSVKQAFESTYDCMGISCADVGGLYDGTTSTYYDGASPCGSSSSSSGSKAGLAIGLTVGGVVVVALLAMFVRRQSSSVEFKSSSTSQV